MMQVDLRALRPRHQKFLLELLRGDGNATGAYRRAGYRAAGHAAEANASRLMKRPDVARAYHTIRAGADAEEDGRIQCRTIDGACVFQFQ